jgi:hypothetical protein
MGLVVMPNHVNDCEVRFILDHRAVGEIDNRTGKMRVYHKYPLLRFRLEVFKESVPIRGLRTLCKELRKGPVRGKFYTMVLLEKAEEYEQKSDEELGDFWRFNPS